MMTKYTIVAYTPQEFNHASNVQTGLFELERQGYVKVKVRTYFAKQLGKTIVSNTGEITQTQQAHPKTSFYKFIDGKSGGSIMFAIDLYDLANEFSTVAFQKCDLVFKRNYESRYVSCLPETLKGKVFKFGLAFGVNSQAMRRDVAFLLGGVLGSLHANLKLDRLLLQRLKKTYHIQRNEWQFVKRARELQQFEGFQEAKSKHILFQTRCFPHENSLDVKQIHEQRYQLIKLLKTRYPNNFKGGFVPSPLAIAKYSDALSSLPSEPHAYLEEVKNSRIVIYTRGLANSPAWKLAEYLSQGKVIIAEPLTAELPVPLVHGKEVLFFKDHKDLVRQITLVLSDESLMGELSRNARTYFETQVHPVVNMRRVLGLVSEKL
ncbi:glycosyltransferase [Mangrovimonas sp. AS39]|uniref:glycosyltransferase n=1 Tax=Mangrovimonas futianensis TaxID=2895523 RepID=UPI001E41B100|nr:glycosyltransferase [Mangrovimonas futianensis]MCF1191230.1 glycosyltransferase [Mangrovimonas futianensis]MCF1194925.1 glycosyltransferase [Mangrovimonas futianensis]